MPYKFAHLADLHLGAFRDPLLRELNLQAFEKAIDICMREKVDFIVIAGDIFDSNLPEPKVAARVARKFKELKDAGITTYVVYGSHDASPTKASMVDIFANAGLFVNLSKKEVEGRFELIKDAKTGAKLTGLSGRKLGLEIKTLEGFNRRDLEAASGFKIFVLHAAISEFLPSSFSFLESIPFSNLPANFAYYACGHVHTRILSRKGDSIIAYPGPLFGYDYRDLEAIAKGERRGFFIVEFDDSRVLSHKFVEIDTCDVVLIEYDANGKSSVEVAEELMEKVMNASVHNKIVLLKVYGELASGEVKDIDFAKLRELLKKRGALVVYLNRNMLTVREKEIEGEVVGETREEIEMNVLSKKLRELASGLKLGNEELIGERGVKLALRLLQLLKQPGFNLTKADYEAWIRNSAMRLLGIEGETEEAEITEGEIEMKIRAGEKEREGERAMTREEVADEKKEEKRKIAVRGQASLFDFSR